MKLGRTYDEED
jgi:hypothetical protein